MVVPRPPSRASVVAKVLGVVCLAAVAGCGARQASVPEAPADDPVLVEGRDIYTRNCASCHGAAGGGGRGPQLNEGRVVGRYPQIDNQIAVVAEGRNNMPAFGEKFSEEQLEAVVRFTREVLASS